MLKLKYFIQQSWLLIVCSFFFGLLIAATNAALSPKIEQNKVDKLNRLAGALLPQAEHFVPLDTEIEIKSLRGQKENVKIYRAQMKNGECVGWSFNATGMGFADKIEMVVAVDRNFKKLTGFNVLSSNETPGFGDKIKSSYYRDQFAGVPAGELRLAKTGSPAAIDAEIVSITGATVSSQAVVNILNSFLTQLKDQMQKKGLIGNASAQ